VPPQPDDDVLKILRAALDNGVTWIDTAPVYGLGYAESLLGRFLRSLPESGRPIVCTKCGVSWRRSGTSVHTWRDLRPHVIRAQCEDSLARLGIEAIDVYLCHWPAASMAATEDAWGVMDSLVREGKAKAIGASNFSVDELYRCDAIAPVSVVQSRFSLLNRSEAAASLRWGASRGVDTIAYGALEAGLLAKGPGRTDWRVPDIDDASSARIRELLGALEEVARGASLSFSGLAVAWTMAWSEISGVLVGASDAVQLEELIHAVQVPLAAAAVKAVAGVLESRQIGEGPAAPFTLGGP
jgi:aryl-alcohol dehydrogenase-like predicted oxidoreductase